MMKRFSGIKAVIISIVIAVVVIGAAAFFYRFQILQYSAETFLRKSLPDYITIDTIRFEFVTSRVVLQGVKILNPQGFSKTYLIEIGEIECRYKLKGKGIPDGVEIMDPVIKRPLLTVLRRSDGRVNVSEMSTVMQGQLKQRPPDERRRSKVSQGMDAGKKLVQESILKERKLSDAITLPDNFIIKSGKMVFIDDLVRPGPQIITFEDIEATLSLVLDADYARVVKIATVGSGNLNDAASQTIRWDIKYDPNTPALTMSNRFSVSAVTIKTFEPYYDRYSPFIFRSGYFSGELVFDFDNGNIGSTNEVKLSNLSFEVKQGQENAQYLQTAVPDLVRYFTNSSGDVIFDFKIKGPMSNPQFYLGPISKQAVAAMAIDKIGQALAQAAESQANPGAAGEGEAKKTDIEKAAEYIEMFKGLMKDSK